MRALTAFRRNPGRILAMSGQAFRRRPLSGMCAVCGRRSLFVNCAEIRRESYKCVFCGAISRNRHVAKVVARLLAGPAAASLAAAVARFPDKSVFEAQASGPVHRQLRRLPGYVCSEYFADIEPGGHTAGGIRCEDVQGLTFADATFDIVIAQDVMEHVRAPESGWREIHRVLRPGGSFVFTIPYYQDRATRRRVDTSSGRDIPLLPLEYHSDGIRDGLVYTEFGSDLPQELNRVGFQTHIDWSTVDSERRDGIVMSWVFICSRSAE